MFANIRRHSSWLWYIISAAVIISFVWYLNPSNDGSNRGGSMFNSAVGTINGRPISRNEYLETLKESELKYFFTYGSWYGSDEFSRQNEGFLERETKQRLFLKEKAKELGVHVSPENVAEWIRTQLGREKPFTEADYNNMLQRLAQQNVTERDFNRFVRDEIAIMHLVQVAGVPGRLVTPQEAEAQYRRENQQISAQVAFFNASNYLSQVSMDATAIANHYTNQQQNFRVPEKIQLSYIEFPASNYFPEAEKRIAAITNLAQLLDQAYLQRGTNYYTDTNGLPMTPEAAKAKIREEQRDQIALVEARKAATDFAEALLNENQRQITALDGLAQKRGLPVKTTEPFSQFESPKGMEASQQLGQIAFRLTPENAFIDEPIVGSEAVYVAGLRNRIPSHVPPLDSILDKVTEDYKRIQSQKMAREAGSAFHSKLTAALAGGKTFTAAATELGATPVTLGAFSQVSRIIEGLDPRIDPGAIKNAAFALKDGETSPFMPLASGGFVLHVDKYIAVSDGDLKNALPNYLANLQKSGQSEAFGEWFTREFQGAKISLVTDKKEEEKDGPTSNAQ